MYLHDPLSPGEIREEKNVGGKLRDDKQTQEGKAKKR